MTPSELVGLRADIETSEDSYKDLAVVSVNHPLFLTAKNRAGTIIFIAWNSITEIRHFPSDRRKPRAPKIEAGTSAPEGEPGKVKKVH